MEYRSVETTKLRTKPTAILFNWTLKTRQRILNFDIAWFRNLPCRFKIIPPNISCSNIWTWDLRFLDILILFPCILHWSESFFPSTRWNWEWMVIYFRIKPSKIPFREFFKEVFSMLRIWFSSCLFVNLNFCNWVGLTFLWRSKTVSLNIALNLLKYLKISLLFIMAYTLELSLTRYQR